MNRAGRWCAGRPCRGYKYSGGANPQLPPWLKPGSSPSSHMIRVGDLGRCDADVRNVPDHLAALENGSRGFAIPDLLGDAMQSQRRTIRTFNLPDAKTRCRATILPHKFAFLVERNALLGNAHRQQIMRWRNVQPLAGREAISRNFILGTHVRHVCATGTHQHRCAQERNKDKPVRHLSLQAASQKYCSSAQRISAAKFPAAARNPASSGKFLITSCSLPSSRLPATGKCCHLGPSG